MLLQTAYAAPIIQTETNEQIHTMKPGLELLHPTTVSRFIEAYRNPRLENAESDYLNAEHINELRDHSEITAPANPHSAQYYPGLGTVYESTIETKQGYGYKVEWGIPEVQRNYTLGLATSPLGTSAGGYNRHLMLNYMRAGNYVGFVAGEGSHQPVDCREARTRISLANTAAALLNFGYHLRSELSDQGHSLHETNRFAYGASRAGAIALVLNAIDTEFDQSIRSSDVIAPSPAIKLDNLDQWKNVGEQLIKEPARAAFIISHLGLRLAIKYRKTLAWDAYHLAHQVEICGGLFNGELDAAANHIPSTKIGRITEYDCDLTCNDGGLEERLRPDTHPNFSFEQINGIHMSIADRSKTMPIMMGFNKAYQEFEVGKITSSHDLFLRAKELAPRQFPATRQQVSAVYPNKVA